MFQYKPILRVLAGERVDPPPIWIMRQAGRYLPEYRALREQAGDFLTLVYTPELAAEVTLQPIRRFHFDAAIIFADILLVPHALGSDLRFDIGSGPHLSLIRQQSDIDRLRDAESVNETLWPIFEALKITKSNLPKETTLIGFAGSPWTTATYMIADRHRFDTAIKFIEQEPRIFDALIRRLTHATIEYLSGQIAAGAEVIKLFDSWAGQLSGDHFLRYVITPTKDIIQELRRRHPDIPIIAFARQVDSLSLRDYAVQINPNGLAIDPSVTIDQWRENIPPSISVQGNLSPAYLCGERQDLENKVKAILNDFSEIPHIFNLGHGIPPQAKIENIEWMLKTLRDWRR